LVLTQVNIRNSASYKTIFDESNTVLFLPRRNTTPVDQGLLIIEDSRSHSDTPHSVGLLWTSDQPVAETAT
jgi:hypothetical protein